jgi:formyl-CoA transferase
MPEANPGALAGLKVIDLSRVLGGPYCGQMLADHGAEVIKVEPPQGDETRLWGPPFDQRHLRLLRRHQPQAHDRARPVLKPEGRDVLLKLLAEQRRADRQFQDRHDGEVGHRLCRHAFQEIPAADPCRRVSGFGADGPPGRLPGYARWCRPRRARASR